MQIYLPIAEIPVNIFIILLLGLVTGFLAGMFGIGGGFLATPLLMFIGIPSGVAVSTSANQIIAASVSGVLAHFRRNNVDIKMGIFLMIGGFIGSSFGVSIFRFLQKIGQIDIVVGLCYVVFLGSIGSLMMMHSLSAMMEKNVVVEKRTSGKLYSFLVLLDKLPLKTYFPRSEISVSVFVPIILSIGIGILVALMGIGGGFMMIPAMIYILRMPSSVVVGTSLFQIVFIASNTTFLQALANHNVDIILAFLMIVSSAIGAQIGTRSGHKINPDKLRSVLAILILSVCIKMIFNLFTRPESLFLVEVIK
jgi:uncharacterized membrane protein YfcA